jgi:hypothetical protein
MDHAARSRACSYSIALSFASGLILDFIFNVRLQTASHAVAFIAISSFTVSILEYSLRSADPIHRKWQQSAREQITSGSVAWAVTLGALFVALIPTSTAVEAAVVERSLRSIVRGGVTAETADKTAEVLAKAESMHVRVSKKLITTIGQNFLAYDESEPNPTVWEAVEQLVTYQSFLNSSAQERNSSRLLRSFKISTLKTTGSGFRFQRTKGQHLLAVRGS